MDWNALQNLTADHLRLYEALRRAGQLSAEGEWLLRQAEDLLRRAALTYLLEPLPAELLPAAEVFPAVAMVNAWTQLQQAWADLQESLYQFAKGELEKGEINTARLILSALLQLEPDHRDYQALLTETYLQEAQARFSASEWDKGRSILFEAMSTQPVDRRQCRLAVLESFVTEGNLALLAEYEPKIQESPLFQDAVNCFDAWANHLVHQPIPPTIKKAGALFSEWDDPEYVSQERQWDSKREVLERMWESARERLKSFLPTLVLEEH